MKRLLVLFLFVAPAQAQYFSAPPYTVTNGTACGAGCAAGIMSDFNQIVTEGNAQYTALLAAINALPASVNIPTNAIIIWNSVAACPSGYTQFGNSVFFRVWDHGRGVDPGRAWNTLQGSQVQTHGHGTGTMTYSTGATGAFGLLAAVTKIPAVFTISGPGGNTGNATSGNYTSDTFPANYALPHCIAN